MSPEVGVVERIAFEFGELALDPVEPGSIGRCPDECDIVVSCPLSHLEALVRCEVIEDQIDPFFDRVVIAHVLENAQNLGPTLPWPQVAPEAILPEVVEGEQLLRSERSRVGRRQSVRMTLPGPGLSVLGTEFDGAELVVTDDVASLGRLPVEPL